MKVKKSLLIGLGLLTFFSIGLFLVIHSNQQRCIEASDISLEDRAVMAFKYARRKEFNIGF